MPERREEVTTEGGLDLRRPNPRLRETIRRLDEAGVRVSLFIDPDLAALDAAKDLGVPAVELHTGRYAHTWREGDAALDELRRAARHAADMGLFVHAGHGLTYRNVVPGRGDPGDRGAQHRPQRREPGGDGRDARRRCEEMLHLVNAARGA